jgi:hypothetical protein
MLLDGKLLHGTSVYTIQTNISTFLLQTFHIFWLWVLRLSLYNCKLLQILQQFNYKFWLLVLSYFTSLKMTACLAETCSSLYM